MFDHVREYLVAINFNKESSDIVTAEQQAECNKEVVIEENRIVVNIKYIYNKYTAHSLSRYYLSIHGDM